MPYNNKIKIVVFGSFYRGLHILEALLKINNVEIAGVVTDDPSNPKCSPGKRVWKHPHLLVEETMVKSLAIKNNIPVYDGNVKTEEFYITLNAWNPDLIYMGTFGQLLNETIIKVPRFGCFNYHPCEYLSWPSMVGPNPFEQMIENKTKFTSLAMHIVNDKFDDGELVYFSDPIEIPYKEFENLSIGDKIITLHKITSPKVSKLIEKHLKSLGY
jgi:methionyl-tRNA formyltransferase